MPCSLLLLLLSWSRLQLQQLLLLLFWRLLLLILLWSLLVNLLSYI
jgi:hypothetical protein